MTILDAFFIFYHHRPEIRQKTEFCLKNCFSGQASMISNRFLSPFAVCYFVLYRKSCREKFLIKNKITLEECEIDLRIDFRALCFSCANCVHVYATSECYDVWMVFLWLASSEKSLLELWLNNTGIFQKLYALLTILKTTNYIQNNLCAIEIKFYFSPSGQSIRDRRSM